MDKIKFEETHMIYNKIKESMELNDEALVLIGINKPDIDKAMKQFCDKGVPKKKAMKSILNMFRVAER